MGARFVHRFAFAALVASAACTRPIDFVSTPREAGTEDGAPPANDDAGAPTTEPGTVPSVRCAGTPRVVVMTTNADLFSFDPTNDALTPLGAFACPDVVNPITPLAIATSDDGRIYVLTAQGLIVALYNGAVTSCSIFQKAPSALDVGLGAGLAVSSSAQALFLGVDQALFRVTTGTQLGTWTSNGSLTSSDHFRALLGTGDGRLFAVLSPGTGAEYRVSSIDPTKATLGATVLVPTAFSLGSEVSAGFALWGSSLLVFTDKAVSRYDFASGALSPAEIVVGFTGSILGAASPPCASAL